MQTPGRKGAAVADRASHARLWLTAGLGAALDLVSKSAGWLWLGGPVDEGGREVVVLPGWLTLVARRNPGIVFGIDFADYLGLGPGVGRALTILLTLATGGLIFYVFAASRSAQRWFHLSCGLVLAGALGNLYDRLVYGHVRDLLQITAHGTIAGLRIDWPYVFNLADVYLVVAVAALALALLWTGERRAPADGDAPRRGGPRREPA